LWFRVEPSCCITRYTARDPPDPANLLSYNLPENAPQIGLLIIYGIEGISLSAAVLSHDPEGEPLRHPEHGPESVTALRHRSGLRGFSSQAP